jgi:cob(I)alamin adenosyltransferase
MKIYTKTGDDGTTGLFGGQRVAKYALRITAYGTVDELNSIIGIALTLEPTHRLEHPLKHLSSLLFTVGSDLATPLEPPAKYHIPRIESTHVEWLEHLIDEFQEELPPLNNFILPGGTPLSAHLHLARTVCRRAERAAVELSHSENIGDVAVRFLNRLSDFLFVAARMANFLEGVDDVPWIPNERK